MHVCSNKQLGSFIKNQYERDALTMTAVYLITIWFDIYILWGTQ